jgi:hypothetical protein
MKRLEQISSIVLFLLLLSISNGFFSFVPLPYQLSVYAVPFNTPQAYLVRLLLGIGLSLILTFLYTFALHRTQKSIADGHHPLKKLLKDTLWEVPVLLVFLYGFSRILDSIFGGHPGITYFAVLLGLPVALVLVFLLSIAPSYFYYKFYSQRKILLSFLIGLVLILIIAVVSYITPRITCDGGKNRFCLAQKENDVSVCEYFSGKVKNNCIVAVHKNSKTVSDCEQIKPDDYTLTYADSEATIPITDPSRYHCIINVARNSNDPKLCELIPDSFTVYERYYRISNGRWESSRKRTCSSFFE